MPKIVQELTKIYIKIICQQMRKDRAYLADREIISKNIFKAPH